MSHTTGAKGLLFCAFTAALSTSACTPTEKYLGGAYEARTADAAPDGGVDGDGGDVTDADASADASVDLGPPCVVGGTTALLPVTLGCAQAFPGHLVVSGGSVYWTVQSGGAVLMRAALVGGGPETLVYDGAGAFGLVVDATFAYYTQPALGRVMRVSLRGGEPMALATKLDQPLSLASDGASLYWTGGQRDGKIMKLDLTPDAQPVTLIDGQTQPRAIAVSDGFVYWTDFADGTILRTADHLTGPADSGVRTASRLASGLLRPTDLVLLGGFVYAPDQAGHVRRVALDGGDLETVAEVDGAPYGVATDGTSIYWSVLGPEGGIYRAPPASAGQGTPFVDGQTDPHFVAVTAENVYWTTWGGRPAVHRLAK